MIPSYVAVTATIGHNYSQAGLREGNCNITGLLIFSYGPVPMRLTRGRGVYRIRK